jgi:hypothetical protein
MSAFLGSGDYTNRVVDAWGTLPEGRRFGGVAGIVKGGPHHPRAIIVGDNKRRAPCDVAVTKLPDEDNPG